MRNTVKWLGFIALVAIIAFSLIGCGPLEEEDDPVYMSGTVSITPNGAVKLGTELTANYTGDEAVKYQWLSGPVGAGGDTAFQPIPGATSQKYTPTEEGDYRVRVYTNADSKTSAPSITVTAGYSDFIGIFVAENVKVTGFADYNEVIDITGTRLAVRDDYTGRTGTIPAQPWDHFEFDIDTWEKIENIPTTGLTAGYTQGYKLTGSLSGWKGYTSVVMGDPEATPPKAGTTRIDIYLKGDGTEGNPFILRRARGNLTATGTANEVINRDLVKKVD
jgi:hypothetical protein